MERALDMAMLYWSYS